MKTICFIIWIRRGHLHKLVIKLLDYSLLCLTYRKQSVCISLRLSMYFSLHFPNRSLHVTITASPAGPFVALWGPYARCCFWGPLFPEMMTGVSRPFLFIQIPSTVAVLLSITWFKTSVNMLIYCFLISFWTNLWFNERILSFEFGIVFTLETWFLIRFSYSNSRAETVWQTCKMNNKKIK